MTLYLAPPVNKGVMAFSIWPSNESIIPPSPNGSPIFFKAFKTGWYSPQQVPSSDPMSQFLNKDYSEVLKKSKEKSKNKIGR